MLTTLAVLLLAQGSDENHRKVYDVAVDSIVAVRAMIAGGERSGSGVVLTKDGLLLVSYSAVPEGAQNVRVWMKGPKFYRAEIVGTSKREEITILRIKPKGDLKPMTMGASAKVRVGDVAYTLGNASNSMINNDQPSLNVGLISGTYRLEEAKLNSFFTGSVFETTAAVNVGMEGAPLLDAAGKMVGFVTLNYSPHRFLGNAIPIDSLRHSIDLLCEGKHPSQQTTTETAAAEAGEAYLGAKVVDQGGKVVVDGVDAGSPADTAGLRKGTVILGAGQKSFKTAAEFAAFLKELQSGAMVTLKIDDDGLKDDIKITLEKKK